MPSLAVGMFHRRAEVRKRLTDGFLKPYVDKYRARTETPMTREPNAMASMTV